MDDPGRTGAYFALFSEIGFIILITVLAGILVGYWVDQRLGTLPLFVLLGFRSGVSRGRWASIG